ncbi:MAG TPA: redoxin domain-containing protein [Flavobacterium sp.]|nr:redoxin domain-containing protein [Flavobacterium sp.]
MNRLFFILVFVTLHFSAFGQVEQPLFSDAVRKNFQFFKTQSIQAYKYGDFERGQFLFDSLVQNQLIGSKFNDFTLRKVSNQKLKISKVKKPIFLVTYAAWCVPSKGEIPAINKLAKEYSKDIEFVVIVWGKKKEAKKFANKFNSKIEICYAHRNYKKDNNVVESMKETLGFPTCYMIDAQLQVTDIRRGALQLPLRTQSKKAVEENYLFFRERLNTLFLPDSISKEGLATF